LEVIINCTVGNYRLEVSKLCVWSDSTGGQYQLEVSISWNLIPFWRSMSTDGKCFFKMSISVGVLLRGQNRRVVSISCGKNQFKVSIPVGVWNQLEVSIITRSTGLVSKWWLLSTGGKYQTEGSINWRSVSNGSKYQLEVGVN